MPFATYYDWSKNLRNRHFLFLDIIFLLISPYIAIIIRLDGVVDFNKYGEALIQAAVLFTSVKLIIFYSLDLYKRFWRSASVDDMARILLIGAVAVISQSFAYVILRNTNFLSLNILPYSIVFIDGIIAIILVASLRFSIRLFERVNQRLSHNSESGKKVVIVGAGYAGIYIIQEMQRNIRLNYRPVAFLDDDFRKKGTKIRGVIVAGGISDLPEVVKKYNAKKVIFAIPSAPGTLLRKVHSMCQEINVEALTLPGLSEFLSGRLTLERVRKIQIEDLLRRDPVNIDNLAVKNYLKNKRVLITGAGGSIGSELSRQIFSCGPSQIILLGHGENSIFDIQNELLQLKKSGGISADCTITSRIADIRFRERLDEIFAETQPQIVFHAAAHKHVPLMEANSVEAVTNNIIGTKNLVDISVKYDVSGFVYISTDKAVNPVSVMGATKRAAEMVVLDAVRNNEKKFCAVRFGNVLGSRGSVLHTFKKQIAEGGPITITDPAIKRYFMTIPEAVQLVLQASVIGKGGEVFVLDMGEPVKIVDLAKDIIKLSGYKVDEDIKIEFVGLRPGEKLFEELFISGESYTRTKHEKILIAANASNFVNPEINMILQDLEELSLEYSNGQIKEKLRELVPEYNCIKDFLDPILINRNLSA